MNRQEKLIVGLLFVTLLVWFFYQDGQAKRQRRILEETRRREAAALGAGQEAERGRRWLKVPGSLPRFECGGARRRRHPRRPGKSRRRRAGDGRASPGGRAANADSGTDRDVVQRCGERGDFVLGRGIRSVCLKEYRETLDRRSGPVQLDFSCRPALAYGGLAGFSTNVDFALVQTAATTATVQRAVAGGLRLVRQVRWKTTIG